MNSIQEQFENHVPEVQDILGSPPNSLIRYGMSCFALISLLLIMLSYFIKYPDKIIISCVLSASSPAVSVSSTSDSRLSEILVKDKQKVKIGQAVAILDNLINYKDVLKLKKDISKKNGQKNLSDFSKEQLGELQDSYLLYKKNVEEFAFFNELKFYDLKIKALLKRLESTILLKEHLNKQNILNNEDSRLGEKLFKLDSNLYMKKGITPYEYVSSERAYLKEQSSGWQSKSSVVSIDVQLNEIKQTILELKLDEKQKRREHIMNINQSLRALQVKIDEWERRTILVSPIEGVITFNVLMTKNQPLRKGESVATIVPETYSKMICKAKMPILMSGGVKAGQEVNISFDNFFASEYGTVKGVVHSVSLTPDEKGYLVLINLPYNLKTSYGYNLPYKFGITGNAEIITKSSRLIERLFKNFRKFNFT